MAGRPRGTLSSPPRQAPGAGVLRAAFAVARKELGESFRDRQTLLYTFVLPLCMYPAMFWIMVQGVLVVQGQKQARDVTIGVVAAADTADAAREQLAVDEEGRGRIEVVVLDPETPRESDVIAGLIEDEEADALLFLPRDRSEEEPAALFFDSTSSQSETARGRVVAALESWTQELRAEAAGARELDPEVLEPILIQTRKINPSKDDGALVLSLLLPILLVVMCVLGAFFPAVDLTAGEKERQTAETTLLLPIPRLGLHLGKIFAVCATSMIAATLNLLALGLSAGHLLGQLAGLGDGAPKVELPIGALISIAPLAALFAFFVSAVLTGVASLAASFKEGQALLGPTQMLFMLPAMATNLPGMELTATTAWIPVVNVSLAFRGLLVGSASAGPLLICVLSLTIAALLAIWFSVRLLSSEEVSLSSETISMTRLLRIIRPR